MKKSLFIITLLLFFACGKEDELPCEFKRARITDEAPTCAGWGIIVNGVVYPSRNIPDGFKRDGLSVCTNYELYNDGALCACCGGLYANILSMRE